MPTFLFSMRAEDLLIRLHKEIEKETTSFGVELLDISFSKGLLKLAIDKPGGVTLDDCVNVNRRVGVLLDAIDIIEGSYRLEVSSPGITRKLSNEKEYKHFTGKKVKIHTAQGTIRGVLKGTDDVGINVEDGDQVHKILFREIVRANLDY